MSTLGIRPGGGCHYLAEGYTAMAKQIFPLVNQYNYGVESKKSISSPNIQRASYTSDKRDGISLVFDQNVKWDNDVTGRFYLDGVAEKPIAVGGTDNIITLKLAGPSTAKNVSYIKGGTWRQDQGIIWGSNNIAALTFCEFPIRLLKD